MKIVSALAWGVLTLRAASLGAQGGITGTVYDSLATRAPLANATVVLVERSRYATSDARGRFRFDSVPDGQYTLGFTHQVLDSLGLDVPLVPVSVTGGHRVAVALAIPGVATVYARLCSGRRDEDSGVIIGRVGDVDDHAPIADATVGTDWTEITLTGGRTASNRVHATAHTNRTGVFRLCDVPIRVALELTAEHNGFRAGPTPVVMDGRVIQRADLALSLRDSASRAAPAGDSSWHAAAGSASLHGVVLGRDGRPLRDAIVGIVGTPDSARTDAAGAFVIEHIPAGTRSIEVRSIGWLPATVAMDFATNGMRDTTLSVTRPAQEMAPVAVAGRANSTSWMELSGFGERRQHGLGAYLTEDEIAKHNYPDLSSILRGVRGITVECVATKRLQGIPCFPMPYMLGVSDYSGAHCTPNYFIDGTHFFVDSAGPPSRYPFSDLNAQFSSASIRGIEVYANPGAIPAQFDLTSSTGCGSIVIWTH